MPDLYPTSGGAGAHLFPSKIHPHVLRKLPLPCRLSLAGQATL
jgi:hypothetical protein